MNTEPTNGPKPISEAKLRANRENGRRSHGPKDTSRTRFNALKDGLTAGVACLGLDSPENGEFISRAYTRLGPRNALEAAYVTRLLWTRLQEGVFLEVERTILTRKPATSAPDDQRSFPFLHDPHALKTLDQLTRQVIHFTRVIQDQIQGLLQVRKENWPDSSPNTPADDETAEEPLVEAAPSNPAPDSAPTHPGTLEACLADTRLIIANENARDYELLAREQWGCLRPANTLEGFVAIDLIQAHWRLVRVLGLENILFERCAVSEKSRQNCGPGFAFIQDTEEHQALPGLRHYEAALHNRIKKRMALLRQLRKQGWQDGPALTAEAVAAPAQSGGAPTGPPPAQTASTSPVSKPTPIVTPVPVPPCASQLTQAIRGIEPVSEAGAEGQTHEPGG